MAAPEAQMHLERLMGRGAGPTPSRCCEPAASRPPHPSPIISCAGRSTSWARVHATSSTRTHPLAGPPFEAHTPCASPRARQLTAAEWKNATPFWPSLATPSGEPWSGYRGGAAQTLASLVRGTAARQQNTSRETVPQSGVQNGEGLRNTHCRRGSICNSLDTGVRQSPSGQRLHGHRPNQLRACSQTFVAHLSEQKIETQKKPH